MGYRILYGTQPRKVKGRKRPRVALLTLAFFALFAAAAYRLVPEQLAALWDIFFPQAQVDALLHDLQSGQSITEAVSTFCGELLNGG